MHRQLDLFSDALGPPELTLSGGGHRDDLVAWVARSRAAQGMPTHIADHRIASRLVGLARQPRQTNQQAA